MATSETERMNGRQRRRKGTEKERRSETGDYRLRRRLVYGSADAHHLLKKTCCSKCVHFACTPMCTDQLAQRNHRSYLTTFLRFSQVERRSPLSHFSTNASRGEIVSQRRLTCRRGYFEATNFVSSELHASIAQRRFAWLFDEKCLLSFHFSIPNGLCI